MQFGTLPEEGLDIFPVQGSGEKEEDRRLWSVHGLKHFSSLWNVVSECSGIRPINWKAASAGAGKSPLYCLERWQYTVVNTNYTQSVMEQKFAPVRLHFTQNANQPRLESNFLSGKLQWHDVESEPERSYDRTFRSWNLGRHCGMRQLHYR